MTVNTERDLKNKEALKKAVFLAATVNTTPENTVTNNGLGEEDYLIIPLACGLAASQYFYVSG